MTSCIHELFERQAERTPQSIAVTFEDRSLTYRELDLRANQLAHRLKSSGVGPEILVGIYAERSLEMVVAILGVLKAGGAYVPLDPVYPPARVAYMVQDAQLRILLTQEKLVADLPAHQAEIICLDKHELSNTSRPATAVTSQNLAYVIYTSGSTGQPKGVAIRHDAVVNFLESMQQEPGLTPQDTTLALTTLCFDIAVLELLLPLTVGARIVLVSREVASDGRQLATYMTRAGVTVMQATPSTWRLLFDAGWTGSKQLRALSGGEALTPGLAQELLERCSEVWNLYGPTETTIWSMIQRVDEGPITLGKPIANTHIFLLDEYLNQAPAGEPGELCIGGAGLARGYVNRADLTADRFIPNPFGNELGSRLYKTGDLARYRPNGEIEILGRTDRQVKVRGYRIELGEIEALLSQHPALSEAAVIAPEAPSGERRLVAYIVFKSRDEQSIAETPSPSRGAERISQWQSVWDEVYSKGAAQHEPGFDISGWFDSYTGAPLPAAEMKEWVDRIVERILELRPKRVLEVGCGTGLLLSRIAPHCDSYWGTDVSAEALRAVQRRLDKAQPPLPQVRLMQCEGAELPTSAAPVNLVVINSVVMFFPGIEYLMRVLQRAIDIVEPGGSIFIGDIRSFPLLQAFQTSIQLQRSSEGVTGPQLWQQIQRRIGAEEQLCVDPEFFFALQSVQPRISRVQVQLKRGTYHNEMTRFRYDVTLQLDTPTSSSIEPNRVDWEQHDLNLTALRGLLVATEPAMLHISGIPNARVRSETHALELLERQREQLTAGRLKKAVQAVAGEGVDPEDVWSLGKDLPYVIEISFSATKGCGYFDILFRHRAKDTALAHGGHRPPLQTKPWSSYANPVFQGGNDVDVTPQVRSYLQTKLPAYMVPSAIVALKRLPRTPNGKIDRDALPMPDHVRSEDQEVVGARDTLERQLVNIWQETLGMSPIGVRDSFFELGGHSLLAGKIFAQIEKQTGRRLSLTLLYNAPTIEQLANEMRHMEGPPPQLTMQAVHAVPAVYDRRPRTPFFCVAALGTLGLNLRAFATELGKDQPFYLLLTPGQEVHQGRFESVEALAAACVEEIRSVQPEGPFWIGGECRAGLVAFEMARQLHAQGHRIDNLTLFDTPVWEKLSFTQTLVNVLRVPFFYLQRGWNENMEGMRSTYRSIVGSLTALVRRQGPRDEIAKISTAGLFRLMRLYEPMLQKYALRPSPLHVTLFRVRRENSRWERDVNMGWTPLATEGVTTKLMPGSHHTMLEHPTMPVVARELRSILDSLGENHRDTEAQRGKETVATK